MNIYFRSTSINARIVPTRQTSVGEPRWPKQKSCLLYAHQARIMQSIPDAEFPTRSTDRLARVWGAFQELPRAMRASAAPPLNPRSRFTSCGSAYPLVSRRAGAMQASAASAYARCEYATQMLGPGGPTVGPPEPPAVSKNPGQPAANSRAWPGFTPQDRRRG